MKSSFWKFLESLPESYPSYSSARNPQVMDILPLPMEAPMLPIPWMAINHHEVWPSCGTFECWHLQIVWSTLEWENATVCGKMYIMNHGFGNVIIVYVCYIYICIYVYLQYIHNSLSFLLYSSFVCFFTEQNTKVEFVRSSVAFLLSPLRSQKTAARQWTECPRRRFNGQQWWRYLCIDANICEPRRHQSECRVHSLCVFKIFQNEMKNEELIRAANMVVVKL